MWIVELAFDSDAARLAARPAHREKLMALHSRGIVRVAGPLADDSGAVIVFDVPGRGELENLMADDPYFRTAGVTVERVREWLPFLT